jgi:hypothetical protein
MGLSIEASDRGEVLSETMMLEDSPNVYLGGT